MSEKRLKLFDKSKLFSQSFTQRYSFADKTTPKSEHKKSNALKW